MRLIQLLTLAGLAISIPASADTIELKTGERIEGTYKGTTSAGATIEVGGQFLTFPSDKVKDIHIGPSSTPATTRSDEATPRVVETTADEKHAYEACKSAVSLHLKAPATATFSDRFGATNKPGKNGPVYTVSGEVDSQNSFSAMLRENFTCKVRRFEDGSWKLDGLIALRIGERFFRR